jgi:hypothetical protein
MTAGFLRWLQLSSPNSSFPPLAADYSPGSIFSHMTAAFLAWQLPHLAPIVLNRIASPLSTFLIDTSSFPYMAAAYLNEHQPT